MEREPTLIGGAGEPAARVHPQGSAEHACLSPSDCLAYLDRAPKSASPERLHDHIDTCEACRVMMAEAVRGTVEVGRPVPSGTFRMLADGERVAGRYQIKRFVARGGMGEVYEAVDTILGERVALKTLAITASDQEDAVNGLLREVRIARKVIHPNVCRILELGIHRRPELPSESLPFLTMDFLTGETLAQRLSRAGALPRPLVIRLLREMAAGLDAVHRAGIVHRDFKSDNVFLVRQEDGTDRCVVMDFGLAHVLEGPMARLSSGRRLMVGTPAYMAPEQLTGRPATPATDVYALGIVTFEMLTGRLPFSGDTPPAVALARLHQPAPAPSSLVPSLERGWDEMTRCCLERDPARRFARTEDVIRALEGLTRGQSAQGRLRRLRWAGLWGLGAAGLIGAGSLGLFRINGARETPTVGGAPATRSPAEQRATERLPHERTAPAPPLSAPDPPLSATRPPVSAPNAEPPANRASLSAGLRSRQGNSTFHAFGSGRPASRSPPPSVHKTEPPDPALFAPATSSRPRHPDDLLDPF